MLVVSRCGANLVPQDADPLDLDLDHVPAARATLGSRNTPTPTGVPVRIRSPGSSVIACEMYETRYGMSKMSAVVRSSWSTSPLRRCWIRRSDGSSSPAGTIFGPIGQNVSKPLPRNHWPSPNWTSRALTSLPHVYPAITSGTCSTAIRDATAPITTASSASAST